MVTDPLDIPLDVEFSEEGFEDSQNDLDEHEIVAFDGSIVLCISKRAKSGMVSFTLWNLEIVPATRPKSRQKKNHGQNQPRSIEKSVLIAGPLFMESNNGAETKRRSELRSPAEGSRYIHSQCLLVKDSL